MKFTGGMVRVRSPYSLSDKMDVVFDRYAQIELLQNHSKCFQAVVTSDFGFIDKATADTDVVMDAALIFVGQDDTIKYTVKKTGLIICCSSMASQRLIFVCMSFYLFWAHLMHLLVVVVVVVVHVVVVVVVLL